MAQLIMVIDDEPELLGMVRDFLTWSGFEVLVAHHPEHALVTAHERHPDLIVIDMMLPQMTGIELAQELRRQGDRHTPLIGMSASRLMRDLAIETGLFVTVLNKPFDLGALLSLLQRYLQYDVTADARQ